MQAYKVKGTIDQSGHLIITEPVNLAPGEVEVIVLQQSPIDQVISTQESQSAIPTRRKTKVKAFQSLFENTEPAPPDFDPDQARWEALKEKHNL